LAKNKEQIMVKVEFLGPIQKDSLELEAKTLQDVAEVLQKDDELKEWLSSSAVAVNDVLVSDLSTPLKDGDKISLLPPVCGG
jgi:molybdopterin synthase sulfur carrier subunit